jgi:alkylation response protein AidB-like acyl-CoA dehydrogenase
MLVAENVVDLSACRAIFSRAASLIDEHYARNPTSRGTSDDLTRLFGETQSAKLFIGDAAIRIVDRALALSGGAGYLNGSPLARASATSARCRSCTRSARTAPARSSGSSPRASSRPSTERR